jgi:anti-sigma regulatory factor (Ser/Thr protein kinase)
MKDAITLKMSLPNIPDIELVAIEGLDRLARHLGIANEKIGEANVLITEAIINALEHSGAESPAVKVEFTMTKQELVILVRDFGKGFDPSTVADPGDRKKAGAKNNRGWGLKLMKTMSDDFAIASGKDGTRITIKKILS